MFCSNCGAQCPDGAVFCTTCGAQLGQQGAEAVTPSAGAPAAPVGGAQPYYAPVTPKAPKQKNPKTKKIVIGVVVGVLVLAAIVTGLILLLTRPETINLNEYLKIEAEGYDGYGSVRATIDWEAIEKKYGDEIEFSDDAKKILKLSSSEFRRGTPITVLSDVINVKLDKSDDCANGEQIAYEWNVPKKLEEAFNVKFEYEKGTYTVSGLKAAARSNMTGKFSIPGASRSIRSTICPTATRSRSVWIPTLTTNTSSRSTARSRASGRRSIPSPAWSNT